jgi:Sel1 repeat-containing protein
MRIGILCCCLLLIPEAFADESKATPDVRYFHDQSVKAAAGDMGAEVCMGELYVYGIGTRQDFASGLSAFTKAADAGDVAGKFMLAMSYLSGTGTQKDSAKALAIFHELDQAGYPPADQEIGVLYATGDQVPKDGEAALSWYRKGAAADDPWAEVRLAIIYHFGEHSVKKDEAVALRWLTKAIAHPTGCVADFGRLLPFVIDVYMQSSPQTDRSAGSVGVVFRYDNGKALDVRLNQSSGSKKTDDAWLAATQHASLPPWPADYVTDDKTVGFTTP